jgi:hypothetical protein
LCFFGYVGHFKSITPPDAIARKRDLDGTFHCLPTTVSHPGRSRLHMTR